MLNKALIITALAFTGFMNLQAIDENEKNSASGALVCNKEKSVCLTTDELEESEAIEATTPLSAFSGESKKEETDLASAQQEKEESRELACEQDQNQAKLFACKNCR